MNSFISTISYSIASIIYVLYILLHMLLRATLDYKEFRLECHRVD